SAASSAGFWTVRPERSTEAPARARRHFYPTERRSGVSHSAALEGRRQMNENRRTTLQVAGGAGLYAALVSIGMLKPGIASAQAFDRAAFQAKGIADTLKALGAADATESKDVTIVSPDIAENGAVVPVGIRSAVANTQMMRSEEHTS